MAEQRLLWVDGETKEVTPRRDDEIPALLADPSGWL